MKKHNIAVIPEDGISHEKTEVTLASMKIIEAS